MKEIYTYTVPMFIKLLGGLRNVLQKAEAHAREQGMSDEVMLADKLAPDMFPLVRQVQIACDNAKGAVARLSGVEMPTFDDSEKSFAELCARIDKTLAFVQSVPENSYEHAAERKVTLPYFPDKYMSGFDYAREYVIPNFIFHVVTAYAIVRKNGVAIGKMDYVNGLPFRDQEA
jgi:hypothetical protein